MLHHQTKIITFCCSILARYLVRTRNINFPNSTTVSVEFILPQNIINNPGELGGYGVDIFYPVGDKQRIKKSFQGQSILVVELNRLQTGRHMINAFVESSEGAIKHESENKSVIRGNLVENRINCRVPTKLKNSKVYYMIFSL